MMASHSHLTPAAVARLRSPAAPIVLLARQTNSLPDAIAPGMAVLGWMLPYTPLHHLLIDAFDGPLVMTSGNLSGEPQVIGNDEARVKLSGFADGFLFHDREIVRRLDDSVERADPPMILRRARGQAPGTMPLPQGFERCSPITAYGGQMKSAICLIRDGQALLSHHLGDLDDALTWDEFLHADADYAALFDHRPSAVACDLHDGYRATRHALGVGLPVIRTQHHHAHLAACLGDNLWPLDAGPVAALILDGLGLGSDGTIWGGELLLGDYRHCVRIAHLRPAPLPGGDRASVEPWRNALGRLDQAGLAAEADRLFPNHPRTLLRQAIKAGVNAPLSSSAGRLFDAVAAVLGLCPDRQSYEGEAAMRLEALAAGPADHGGGYELALLPGGLIDPASIWPALLQDLENGVDLGRIAGRFHTGLGLAFARMARGLVESGQAKAVALSGGCFQNAVLTRAVLRGLEGLPVLTHRTIPANDGGLALGQALIAGAESC
jgi:hydrogenase maturation protein HypF